MKRNKIFDKLNFKNIILYCKANILFLIYILIILLLDILLKLITIGSITFRGIICDLIVSLVIGSFMYLIKPKGRSIYLSVWIFIASAICVINTIYYEFYQSFVSINLIQTASMLGEVHSSLLEKLKFYQFVYLLFPVCFILINKYIYKKNKSIVLENNNSIKKLFKNTLLVSLVLLIIVILTLSKSEATKFVKQWNKNYIVHKFGIYTYTINDTLQSVRPKLTTSAEYDEVAHEFRNYYACKWEKKNKTNEYTNKFKGKNVIFIHAESIQNFLINLKINGKEVTPNINKFISEGMYFSKFYPQISVGTSSDTEFTLTTGLMPSSSGTVFVNYYNRKYYALPKYFNKLGYYTFSTHANYKEYWNRSTMYKTLGYQDFYSRDYFDVPDESSSDFVGLGLSDSSFFKQLIPIIKNIKSKNEPFYGTVITLSNHSPFDDLEKYDDFDVTMDYTYTNSYGNKVKDSSNYLEGTKMGNYLKSAHYADRAFGEFIDGLKKNNLLENTIIVFYGDHEARLARSEFDMLYNYDPETNSIKEADDEGYIDVSGYNYDLLKNTPLVIWSNEENLKKEITDVMGMYDVLPTIANMFGFEEKYSLGHDIFSSNEKIVIFPNGNVLTNNIYYSNSNDEYITFNDNPIDADYIEKLKEYSSKILDISNGIVYYDLIDREEKLIGECEHE